MSRRGRIAALSAAVAALAAPGIAEAGYGVQPIGQTFAVQTSGIGYITSPGQIDFLVYLDGRDSEPWIWVSDSPGINSFGSPAGTLVASCYGSNLRPWTEPNKYVCSLSTVLMKPDRTYYWWLDYRRLEDGSTSPQKTISGPFAFSLVQAPATPPATPPAVTPPATPPTTKPPATKPPATKPPQARPTVPESTKTWESAATLPTRNRFSGERSIKHQRLTDVIHETMKALDLHRVLAIGCWTEADFESVARSANFAVHHEDTSVAGFWLGRQPRWLHLAPYVCTWIQKLFDTKQPTARRAFGLTVALHETIHAYGIANEALTNCFAVQLAPLAARYAGLSAKKADHLGRLSLSATRRTAPPGYWNAQHCRDGGKWDLLPGTANLR
jgi:hypothetical protein